MQAFTLLQNMLSMVCELLMGNPIETDQVLKKGFLPLFTMK
jgi:hypothetical protein